MRNVCPLTMKATLSITFKSQYILCISHSARAFGVKHIKGGIRKIYNIKVELRHKILVKENWAAHKFGRCVSMCTGRKKACKMKIGENDGNKVVGHGDDAECFFSLFFFLLFLLVFFLYCQANGKIWLPLCLHWPSFSLRIE